MQMAQQQMLAQQMMSQQYQMTQQQQQTQLANHWIQQQNSAQQAQQWLQDMQRSIPQSQESPTAKWQDERKNRWTQQERRQEQPTATAFEEQEVQKIDWSAKARGAFQRCFLSPSTSESPTAENLRQQLGICIEDKGDLHVIPAPISSFDELNCLPSYVLQDLQWNGITNPLPIQCQALPLATGLRSWRPFFQRWSFTSFRFFFKCYSSVCWIREWSRTNLLLSTSPPHTHTHTHIFWNNGILL